MDITPKNLFDERIPNGMKQFPDRVKNIQTILQFNILGDSGGTWVVNTISDPPFCSSGSSETAQCFITMPDTVFLEILAAEPIGRPQIVMKYIVEGTLEIDGDVTQAMKLSKIFQVGDLS